MITTSRTRMEQYSVDMRECQNPAALVTISQRSPWYGHTIFPSSTVPRERGQDRWAHASLMQPAVPSLSLKMTHDCSKQSNGICRTDDTKQLAFQSTLVNDFRPSGRQYNDERNALVTDEPALSLPHRFLFIEVFGESHWEPEVLQCLRVPCDWP